MEISALKPLELAQAQGDENKYLTFVLGKSEYGLEIQKVKEIIGMMDFTRVPKSPHYIKGVINLRGKVIPIIDLRLKFRMQTIDYTKESCIVVVDIDEKIMGVVVDSVSEVIDIKKSEIEPAPAFGEEIDSKYILGMAKVLDDVKVLVNIEKVLVLEEFDTLPQGSESAK